MSNGSYKILIKDSPPARVASSPYSALLAWAWKSARDTFYLLRYICKIVYRGLGKIFGYRTTDPSSCETPITKIAEIGVGFAEVVDNLCRRKNSGFRIIPISTWSRIIEWFIIRPKVDYRRLFDHSISSVPLLWISGNHTHRISATYRTSSNRHLKCVVSEQGFIPYQVSCSLNDYTDSDGTRYFYGLKDLKVPFKSDLVDDRHVIVLCDVDYYADMNAILSLNRPVLMYTFYPKTPGEVRKEYEYSITDDVVKYTIFGGATYEHNVWDYSGDTVSVLDDCNNLIVYDISQKELDGDPDHRIIGLYPTCKLPFPFWLHFEDQIGLQRRRFTYGDYSVTRSRNQLYISPSGSPHSFTIKETLYTALLLRGKYKQTVDLTPADIERHLNFDKAVTVNFGSAIAAAHVRELMNHLDKDMIKNIPTIVETTKLTCCYQTLSPLIHEVGKESCVMITSPLVSQPAVFPMKSYNNDVACIQGRVDRVKNTIWPAPIFENYASEFIEKLIPEEVMNTGCPLSLNDVVKIQDKPMQRARILRDQVNMSVLAENKMQAFIKSEAYSNFTDPRNITTMSSNVTTLLSSYTYAFKEVILKPQLWYAPGMCPTEMVQRLQVVVKDGALASDFSRFDGTISYFMQFKITVRAMMRYFKEPYRPELSGLIKSVFKRKAITKEGYRYDPGFGTRSGSPLTTDGNTMMLAYVCFCGLRELGLAVDDSWNALGLYCGDDAVSSAIDGFAEKFQFVCRSLGLTVEVLEIPRSGHVPFLGRIFYDPLTCQDSIQDPRRTLAKIHLTSSKGVTPNQAAYNRAIGYLTTDKLTPIISDWCQKVVNLTGVQTLRGVSSEEAWRISNAWPQKSLTRCRDLFKDCLCMDEAQLKNWEDEIAKTEHMMEFPVVWDNERQVKIDCVMDGELYRNLATIRISNNTKQVETCQTKQTENQPKQTENPKREAPEKPQSCGNSAISRNGSRSSSSNPIQSKLKRRTRTGAEEQKQPSTEQPRTYTTKPSHMRRRARRPPQAATGN